MSILVKPYEISVWDDIWDSTKGEFIEKHKGVIGSDKMIAQCRAFDPNLIRNVNGEKKLTFKMYYKYVDITTGEETINPFVDWLVNERKVKLYYEDTWYDFVIKDVSENSANYLYTYQLEDAIVTEMSKNGFGTILDPEVQNDMGNAETLASRILEGTGWSIDSEKFVERIEENLVYVTITKGNLPSNAAIYQLLDSVDTDMRSYGVQEKKINREDFFGGGVTSKTVLAFYSACKNKPYRFQFISLDNYSRDSVKTNKNNVIETKDCQYFIEFWPDNYQALNGTSYFMPEGCALADLADTFNGQAETDTQVSVWYKGYRYGYAQKAEYSPVLGRYINEYKKAGDETKYYGFIDNQYISPTFITNLVSNTEFKNTIGWIGASITGKSEDAAIVENVYGRFDGPKFINCTEDLKNGVFDLYINEYCAYMHIVFPNANSIVFNDGLYDKRKQIGNMGKDTKWAYHIECVGSIAPNEHIGEYTYEDGGYTSSEDNFIASTPKNSESYKIYTIDKGYANKEDFMQQSHVRIALTPAADQEYYIKNIEFFEARYNNTTLITPSTQDISGVTISTYNYFSEDDLKDATSDADLKNIEMFNEINKDYLPVFNKGAEKIRSVKVRESNHFNNLQSIAETFECWIDFDVKHNAYGQIEKKWVRLKNYSGDCNQASFRYGLNLKDIQRTWASKNITTKLIVKQNNNELGEDGFCTIQRAAVNPTGENYIYDFQYYQKMGLMDKKQYFDILYSENAEEFSGPDIEEGSECKLHGYFSRLRGLNDKIIDENKLLSGVIKELATKKAELKVAEAAKSAAIQSAGEVAESFRALAGIYPWEVYSNTIYKIELCGKESVGDYLSKPSTFFKDNSTEAKANNAIYCASDNFLDFYSKSDPPRFIIRFNKNWISVVAYWNTLDIKENVEVKIYFYPKVYTSENDTGTTVEVPVVLTFLPNKTTEIDGKNYSYCIAYKLLDIEINETESIEDYRTQYCIYKQTEKQQDELIKELNASINSLTTQFNTHEENIDRWKDQKTALNNKFYQTYSRFIQEGTWIGEEYVDDETYYTDALSVLYNSCYPQVAYTINVLALSQLEGYEDFVFQVGEKTHVIDPDFFGEALKEEVVITEMSNMLDNPNKDTIKVQNFKNQFQDLFQKITATSQQIQYNSGSYERGANEVQTIVENPEKFVAETIENMAVSLSNPDLESISTDGSSCVKIVDGKILFGKKTPTGNEWTIGMSVDGISANKINAGQIDTSIIQIMNRNKVSFRWDAYGITALSSNNSTGSNQQFVRFDEYGIYGIKGKDGLSWHATGNGYDKDPLKEIDAKATFALTWEGLKVTGNNSSIHIGKQQDAIMTVYDHEAKPTFTINNDGSVALDGILYGTDDGNNVVFRCGTHEDDTCFSAGLLESNKSIVTDSQYLELYSGSEYMDPNTDLIFSLSGKLAGFSKQVDFNIEEPDFQQNVQGTEVTKITSASNDKYTLELTQQFKIQAIPLLQKAEAKITITDVENPIIININSLSDAFWVISKISIFEQSIIVEFDAPSDEGAMTGEIQGVITYEAILPSFKIMRNGDFYANKAFLEGGSIGHFNILPNSLQYLYEAGTFGYSKMEITGSALGNSIALSSGFFNTQTNQYQETDLTELSLGTLSIHSDAIASIILHGSSSDPNSESALTISQDKVKFRHQWQKTDGSYEWREYQKTWYQLLEEYDNRILNLELMFQQ